MTQLVIRYHRVNVRIEDQIAVTHVDQVFYNPNQWQVEGVYFFPIPVDAAVSSFTLWVDGEPVQGEILNAQQARQTYEEIVRSLQDPALLEYAGRGAVKASIFPIPAGGERRIELEYSQALPAEEGLVRYVYPLNTEKFSLWPLDEVSVTVDIVSTGAPLRAVYSTSHAVAVSRDGERRAAASYEDSRVLPDSDFVLYYSLGEAEAFHLLTYRNPHDLDDPDGYYLLLLAARPDAAERPQPKDILLVLDRSGSMEGEKFQQAQQALIYVLERLNPQDRFNVITFSSGLEGYARGLRPASEAGEAIAWVQRQGAQGSTDINRALLEAAAMSDGERPFYLVFLTDGLPTAGEVESPAILDNFARSAPETLRLFAFGVGYDVDTFLLDSLAQEHHGNSFYVAPGERLDEALSTFYNRISAPVLTGLSLDFGELDVYDGYPEPLPDLFAGAQIVAVGRYRQGGVTTVTLRGAVDGREQTLRFTEQAFTHDSTEADSPALAAIPRLWATRKIGYLLNQVRLHGPDEETIAQIVRLSIRYGIVTPYTSYLVTENAPLGEAEQSRIVEKEIVAAQESAAAPAYGQEAVERAAGQGGMAEADVAAAPALEAADMVRVAGERAYVNNGGVWTDTAFDPQTMSAVKVAFLSEDYFTLAARPELAPAFALGQRVIAFSQGVAYEVTAADSPVPDLDLAQPAEQATPTPVPGGEPPQEGDDGGSPGCLGALLPLGLIAVAGMRKVVGGR
jgi:Ca-activated chloride channel family protein